MLRFTRYVLTWPRFLGWLFPLLAILLFAARDLRLDDDAVLTATWRPWVARFWKYSTTLGAGMVLWSALDGVPRRVMDHERVHVRQFEDAALAGLVVGLVVSIVELQSLWLLLWPAGALLLLPHYLGAVLRGGHVYRDAEHERSAYAQTDIRVWDGDTHWLEVHESRPREW